MRTATALVLLVFVPSLLWAAEASSRSPQFPGVSIAVYDENPSHIWNRLYAALRVREDPQGNKYGEDSLDPMLWRETEHLLSQPSAGLALRTMNEFLRIRAETLIESPLKHAILQHDLWAVFDWSVQQYSWRGRPRYDNEKRELQTRLVEVLRRLALTRNRSNPCPTTMPRRWLQERSARNTIRHIRSSRFCRRTCLTRAGHGCASRPVPN